MEKWYLIKNGNLVSSKEFRPILSCDDSNFVKIHMIHIKRVVRGFGFNDSVLDDMFEFVPETRDIEFCVGENTYIITEFPERYVQTV